MNKKILAVFPLAGFLCLPLIAHGQTAARDYYEEIGKAGINALATFVCFPEKEPETFFLAGRSRDFAKTLKAKGLPGASQMHETLAAQGEEFMYWEGFKKGVSSGPSLFQKEGDSSHWASKLDLTDKHIGGEARISINWATLRYRLDIRLDSMAQPYGFDGRCEPIE